MEFIIRGSTQDDIENIVKLYKRASLIAGTIARTEHEITKLYVENNLCKSLHNGLSFVAINTSDKSIIAEIHAYKLQPIAFDHVLSELTIVVDPAYQGNGIGYKLFSELLNEIERSRSDIYRVELITRESNHNAIKLYKKLGFIAEGKLLNRIVSATGRLESDIPMCWFNKNYNKNNR